VPGQAAREPAGGERAGVVAVFFAVFGGFFAGFGLAVFGGFGGLG
jgi:hypothetical protein